MGAGRGPDLQREQISSSRRFAVGMTQQEKEVLADRIVALLKSEDLDASLQELSARVKAGDEGKDGLDSVVLAVAMAMREHLRR